MVNERYGEHLYVVFANNYKGKMADMRMATCHRIVNVMDIKNRIGHIHLSENFIEKHGKGRQTFLFLQ